MCMLETRSIVEKPESNDRAKEIKLYNEGNTNLLLELPTLASSP